MNEVERFDDRAQLNSLIAQAKQQQQQGGDSQPIVVYVTQQAPAPRAPIEYRPMVEEPVGKQHVNLHGLLFIAIMCVVGICIFSILVVACHETPQVNQLRNIPNCHFLC
jgi:hypothetical protein